MSKFSSKRQFRNTLAMHGHQGNASHNPNTPDMTMIISNKPVPKVGDPVRIKHQPLCPLMTVVAIQQNGPHVCTWIDKVKDGTGSIQVSSLQAFAEALEIVPMDVCEPEKSVGDPDLAKSE